MMTEVADQRPLFSFVVPAYNEENYLPGCIASVRQAQVQAGVSVEVIVSDNMSTDRTVEVARELGAKVAQTPVKAISSVRNAGAALATGHYLVFLDADNRISANMFTEIAAVMKTGRYVGGGVANVKMDRQSIGTFLFNTLPLWAGALIVTRVAMVLFFTTPETFRAMGRFDDNIRIAEDYDFAKRLKRYGKKRGLKYKNLYSAHVIVSTRKYSHYGDFFLLKHPIKFIRLCLGDQRVADEFWYHPDDR